MIDPKELRIGNWISLNNLPVRTFCFVMREGKRHITFTHQDTDSYTGGTELFSYFDPIPLTPEWLERLGFDKDTGEKESQPFYDVFVWVYGSWRIKFDNTVYIGPEIKYVHQLQNLWKALTGEEL